jgi:hypothetical protein
MRSQASRPSSSPAFESSPDALTARALPTSRDRHLCVVIPGGVDPVDVALVPVALGLLPISFGRGAVLQSAGHVASGLALVGVSVPLVSAVVTLISPVIALTRAAVASDTFYRPGSVRPLEAEPGLPLGAFPGTGYTESCAVLLVGATLLLFSDGLLETRLRSVGEGLVELEQVLGAPTTGLEPLLDHVVESLTRGHNDDDIAVLAVTTLGAPAEAGSAGR